MFYILETQKKSARGEWLIELRDVIKEIGTLDVDYWLLQDIDIYGGFPAETLRMHCQVFEKKTSTEPKGFYMSLNDFQIFNNPDMRVADGTFIAINSHIENAPLLVLDFFDSGRWFVATTNELIGERLVKCGWGKSSHFPRLRGFPDWVDKFKKDKNVIESGVVFIDWSE